MNFGLYSILYHVRGLGEAVNMIWLLYYQKTYPPPNLLWPAQRQGGSAGISPAKRNNNSDSEYNKPFYSYPPRT